MKKKSQKKVLPLTDEQVKTIVHNTFLNMLETIYGMKFEEMSKMKGRMDNMSKDIIEIGQFARTVNSTYEDVLEKVIKNPVVHVSLFGKK